MTKPNAFVALYVGDTVASSRIVAASADADLVSIAAGKMLESELLGVLANRDNSGSRRDTLRLLTDGEPS